MNRLSHLTCLTLLALLPWCAEAQSNLANLFFDTEVDGLDARAVPSAR